MLPRAAAIYCRLSQDRTGAGIVVERQERDCRALAEKLGWSIGQVFVDNDESAYVRKRPRPAYTRLLRAIETGEADAVLAWHTDRLHRSPSELERYIDICEPRAVPTQTHVGGPLDLTTPSGRMIARSLGAIARYESEQTATRTKAGKTDAASRGEWAGGQRMYGYQTLKQGERPVGGHALAVVPEEAATVQDAAARVLAGESLRSVARDLNARGSTTTTGQPWTGSALRKVLLRPTTAGFRSSAGRIVTKGQWEPLIDEDLWRGVVAILSDPARRTTDRYARRYLGSGLYLCGVCGGPLTGNTTAGGVSQGQRRTAYRCRVADRDGKSHVVRDTERLDAFVVALILARLAEDDLRAATAPAPVDTSPLHAKLAWLDGREAEAAVAYSSGDIELQQLTSITRALRSDRESVERELSAATADSVLADFVNASSVEIVWQSLPLDRQRAVLAALFEVTVLPRIQRGRLKGGAFDARTIRVDWRVPDGGPG